MLSLHFRRGPGAAQDGAGSVPDRGRCSVRDSRWRSYRSANAGLAGETWKAIEAVSASAQGLVTGGGRTIFPPGASNLMKFKALRDYLYHHPPLLSGRQPYLYNFEDDRSLRAKLLPVRVQQGTA